MSSPIKDVLQTLGRHAETIERAITGVVSQHTGEVAPAITALRQVSALRAVGSDGYRLHPRLKEYLQDHLQIYPAFQSLAEIGSRITNIHSLWMEADRMISGHSDQDSIAGLTDSIQSGVFDVVDSMDRNLLLLQTLVSTRYGNVKSLALKESQNRYYQQQTRVLSLDLARLSTVSHTIEQEAEIRGVDEVSLFLRRHLLGRILPWQQSLSELQTLIRRDIFRTRQVELDNKRLARLDLLLRNQPAWRGFDADLSGEIPVFLLAASLPALSPNVEPLDTDRLMLDEMEGLAKSLPPKKVPTPDPEPPVRHKRIIHEKKPPVVVPGALALDDLIKDLNKSTRGISLCEWQLGSEDALSMSSAVWLVFSLMALRSDGFRVNLVLNDPRPGERFSQTFRDAFAYSKKTYENIGKQAMAVA